MITQKFKNSGTTVEFFDDGSVSFQDDEGFIVSLSEEQFAEFQSLAKK